MIVDLSNYDGMSEEQATHAAAQEITKTTMERRSILGREIRSYEVSLWSLQDEFITVLKWSDVENTGRIEEPKMAIDVDGTEDFTFSIPMYMFVQQGTRMVKKENPNWYTITKEYLLLGMRKIKVIFNKMTDDEMVFEFLITKTNEEHDGDVLTCRIACEGLAFHELGKIGYKYSLSYENFKKVYDKWVDEELCEGEEPIQNIEYWCSEINLEPYDPEHVDSTKWYYDIRMDWSSFYTPLNVIETDIRSPKKVYEEAYVTDWDGNLNPVTLERAREKARTIEISESNIYNITQTIAEQFGVHCRYEYLHDANYHITGRLVIFYNNYLKEKDRIISLTYPYSASSISRELDSTDITTKLYVSSIDDDSLYDGYVSIMNSKANKTKEDYLLDFDYLHDIGAVTDEQYADIIPFQKKIRQANDKLTQLATQLTTYNERKVDLEAKIAVYNNSYGLDEEQINKYNANIAAIGNLDGTNDSLVTLDDAKPDYLLVREDENGDYYIGLTDTKIGILPDTIRLYRSYSSTAAAGSRLTNEITTFKVESDEYGNAKKITGIKPSNNSNILYALYTYDPILYYSNILTIWQIKLANDKNALDDLQEELGTEEGNTRTGLLKIIYDTSVEYDSILEQKNKLLRDFEHMMGPALREGYWSPENYQDYGEKKIETGSLSDATVDMTQDSGDGVLIGWDDQLFDDEQKLYYQVGVNEEHVYYPCIDLSTEIDGVSIFNHIKDNPTSYSFIFGVKDYELYDYNPNDIRYLKIFSIGSQALIRFVKQQGGGAPVIKPVLLLIGAATLSEEELEVFNTTNRRPRIAQVSTSFTAGATSVTTTITNAMEITSSTWLDLEPPSYGLSPYSIVYPRIKISNLLFKNNDSDLAIVYEDTLLTNYVDYSVTTRTTERQVIINSAYETLHYPEYYITLKLENYLSLGYSGEILINYALSNAGTAIYLDAKEVLEENSRPKVSYTVSANVIDTDRMRTAYTLLSQLVMINDIDLKFHDTFGYISHVDLDLDAPWNDEYEIKNYKTKFEDLFSTIVAESEDMKKNNETLTALSSGYISLNKNGFANILQSNQKALFEFLDNYIETSPGMQTKLEEIFTDVGTIISTSEQTYGKVQELTDKNGAILSGLASQVSEALQPRTYRQETQPVVFKIGDIWIQTDSSGATVGTYVATSDSHDSTPGHGFVRTYGGGLASTTGECIDIDAVEGYINIGITNILDPHEQAGINLVSSGYTEDSFSSRIGVSSIHLDPRQIRMAGSRIELLTGTGSVVNQTDSASSVIIDGGEGIWIGSDKGITLFSGTSGSNDVYTGANVEIKPDHILLGVSSTGSATFVEMNENHIYMGAASDKTYLDDSTPTTSHGGIDISSNGIILAAVDVTGKSIVNILPNQISLGTIANNSTNFVQLGADGITIGSNSALNIDTANMAIHSMTNASGTDTFRLGSAQNPILEYENGSLSINVNDSIDITNNANFNIDSGGNFNINNGGNFNIINGGNINIDANNLLINTQATSDNPIFELKSTRTGGTSYLKITSSAATLGGWILTADKLYSGDGNSYVALSSKENSNYAMWCGNTSPGSANFAVKRDGSVYLKKLIVSGQVVDFTQAFNSAVSLSGAWSGDKFVVSARLYNNDALSKTATLNGSILVGDFTLGSPVGGVGATVYNMTGNVYTKIGTTTSSSFTIEKTIDISTPYNYAFKLGWNRCIEDATQYENAIYNYTTNSSNVYTGTPHQVPIQGVGMVWVIDNYELWASAGNAYKNGTIKTLYDLPNPQ